MQVLFTLSLHLVVRMYAKLSLLNVGECVCVALFLSAQWHTSAALTHFKPAAKKEKKRMIATAGGLAPAQQLSANKEKEAV